MMQILPKTYTLTVVIQEGNDEFWESFRNKTGCDQVVQAIQDSLSSNGFEDAEVYLSSFSHEPHRIRVTEDTKMRG